MKPDELQIIKQLTGFDSDQIKLANDGFWSRGYVINNGEIVFKFKKSPEVSYKTEIKALNFVNSLNLSVNLQKVGWISSDDTYLGVYGVVGRSLNTLTIPNYTNIGEQLANFLHQIHRAHPKNANTMTQENEITIWRERYQKSHDFLAIYFSDAEITRLDSFFLQSAPNTLHKLGEKLVFSHGDLGDSNILVDENGKIGVIDFSEMLYLDEAADFMDVGSDRLRQVMLKRYKADDVLKEKVRIRILLRPLFVLGDYARRGDKTQVKKIISRIKELLGQNHDKL